ncbi:hypothetical protein APICC_05527 [Apis cerana cerana]|uniref:Uncharacterized protein n=1 Tax=Apis cerana cerana TaxID=94128 RepID=A0A2A3EKV1_APICC|nr:hypothetical protein APICC_05527 [Apis cerana cerana]
MYVSTIVLLGVAFTGENTYSQLHLHAVWGSSAETIRWLPVGIHRVGRYFTVLVSVMKPLTQARIVNVSYVPRYGHKANCVLGNVHTNGDSQ